MGSKLVQISATTREFTFELLNKITDNFSKENIIGRGGYGVVYKGVLENGEEIALKKLHQMPGLDDKRFRNEFNNLMRAQHPNIVRLVGYCYNIGNQRIKYKDAYIFAHVEQRVLCFEYLHGGSLDKYISDESGGLDWHTRFKIIKGVCDGINYLHNGSKDPIYHLDMKPANILLDKNMVPKIGDFGLSRLFPSTKTCITGKIIGTFGYMPPEYIERYTITSKNDVFSLGVIIVRLMAGDEGYTKFAHMSSEDFLQQLNENWEKRLQQRMSSRTSEQLGACIKIAERCLEADRKKRPTIAEIVDELNHVDTAESSSSGQVTNFQRKHALNRNSWSERRGRIVFSTTYRPPVPFDIFSSRFLPSSNDDEQHLTDGVSYNYNGSTIPPAALKALLKRPSLADEANVTDADVDAGHVSGLVFVSERDDGLETLHISLHFKADSKVKVFSLADIFGDADFSSTRLEDSGCIGGGYRVGSHTVDHFLIYVSTKELVQEGCNTWTVVYKTNLATGKTERLTPKGTFDLSPSVSPSGKTVAVASFEGKSWNNEIENLKTDIYVMNVDSDESQGLGRKILIKNGGWPTWGSDNVIFFHRGTDNILPSGRVETAWAVFRYNLSTEEMIQVTPEEFDAVTPAAIDETKVAVATIRQKSSYNDVQVEAEYRHIEIFDTNVPGLPPVQITQKTRPESDHYSPFVLDGGRRIGYHRCNSELLQHGGQVYPNLDKLESPVKDVGLFRLSGVLPTISTDGSKLAFIDNEFKEVWVADNQGLRMVYEERGPNNVFSPVWNQNPDKDILYVCIGTAFDAHEPLEIYAIYNASGPVRKVERLTHGMFNNAFPSSSPDGNKFVFRSTRDGGEQRHKNLYIMLETYTSESEEGWVTRLTRGRWTDTQCQWSPNGDWIVFSSTRDGATEQGNDLDPGYFSAYLVKPTDPTVLIRVMTSGDNIGGHVNHPVFSPDGRSIAVTADLAAVSVDPISLPRFMHAVRRYGDIFVVDIDPEELKKGKDVKGFRRITHSRYECGTPAWTTTLPATDSNALWSMPVNLTYKQLFCLERYKPACPYNIHRDKGNSWHMTGLSKSGKEKMKKPTKLKAHWSLPPVGCLKINTDSCFIERDKTGSSGLVVRNAEGTFLRGQACWYEHAANASMVEALAIREGARLGARLAAERNYEHVVIESDSKEVINLINGGLQSRSELGAICNEIREIIRALPSLSVSYIGRDANQAAHLCAKQACLHRRRCMWINYTPGFLTRTLLTDCNPIS